MTIGDLSGPLERSTCLELLGETGSGRVATTDKALPLILPVHYWVLDDHILFAGSTAIDPSDDPIEGVIAFEVAGFDPASDRSWSVQVRGIAKPHDSAGPAISFLDTVGIFGVGYRSPDIGLLGTDGPGIG